MHLKAAVRATIDSKVEVRNIWYLYNGEANTFDMSDMCDAILAGFYTPVRFNLSDKFRIYGIDFAEYTGAAPYHDPKGWGPSTFFTASLQGAETNEPLPYQCAAVLVGSTATKHVFARKFYAGLTEPGQNNSILVTTAQTNFNTVATNWMQGLNLGGTLWLSECWGPTHGFNTVSGARADSIVGTNRRRKIGVGI